MQGVIYDIVGAVYSDRMHFISRYFLNGKVFESDGMKRHHTSTENNIRREALSEEIRGPYEESLAGNVGRRRITEAYYTRR